MKEIKIEELRKVEVGILQYIDKICVENNINYFVAYGSLIGSVLYNGFIPWDDDVDIALLREDYEKLIKILAKTEHPYYKLLDYSLQKDYFYPYAKLIDNRTIVDEGLFDSINNYGLFVDIFPLDNVPSDKKSQDIRTKKLLKCQKIAYWWAMDINYEKNKFKKLAKSCLKKLVRIYGLNRIMSRYEKISTMYNQTQTEYCTHNFPVPTCVAYNKKSCEKVIRHKFEDIEINIPEDYDKILRAEYGDYTIIPPKEQQISNHTMKYYWKN